MDESTVIRRRIQTNRLRAETERAGAFAHTARSVVSGYSVETMKREVCRRHSPKRTDLAHQLGGHTFAHGPTDEHTREEVDDNSEGYPSSVRRHECHPPVSGWVPKRQRPASRRNVPQRERQLWQILRMFPYTRWARRPMPGTRRKKPTGCPKESRSAPRDKRDPAKTCRKVVRIMSVNGTPASAPWPGKGSIPLSSPR